MDPIAADKLRELFDRVFGSPAPAPMPELVARLDAWLAQHRPNYYAQLLPGLTDSEWANFVAQLGVPMPDGFRVFYQWRNGQGNYANFRGNQMWMPAEEVVRTKQLMDGMIGHDFEPGWWERSWVPFLHNGAGSYLCVDASEPQPGRLVEFWNRDHDRPIVSPSLEGWLNHFVTSLERDKWEETKYGFECVKSQEVED